MALGTFAGILGITEMQDSATFTIRNAPYITIATFLYSATLSATITTKRHLHRALHDLVEVLWILSSIVAFVIAATAIAGQSSRADAARWSFQVGQQQVLIQAEAAILLHEACAPKRAQRRSTSATMLALCSDLQLIVRRSVEIHRIATTRTKKPEPMTPLDLKWVSPALQGDEAARWKRLSAYIAATNEGVEGYNWNRREARRLGSWDGIRLFWIWVYPAIAAFRFHRAIAALPKAVSRIFSRLAERLAAIMKASARSRGVRGKIAPSDIDLPGKLSPPAEPALPVVRLEDEPQTVALARDP